MPKKRACTICERAIDAERLRINAHTGVLTCSKECSRLRSNRAGHLNSRAKRRLNNKENFSIINYDSWRKVVKSYGGKCAYCGFGDADTVDHIVPLSRGGRHALPNMLPCCDFCNNSKADMFLVEWRAANLTPIFDELSRGLDLR